VVTGASRGIGAAVASDLAQRGANLILVAHPDDQARLDRVAEACRRLNVDADPAPIDLSDSESISNAMKSLLDTLGGIDFLVNNAFADEPGSVTDVALSGWDRTLRVSLTASMLMAKAVLPGMVEKGAGAIVNVSSQRAFASGHAAAAYEAAKAGLVALTRSVAVDFAPMGIRCNCLSPGFIKTERTESWLDSDPRLLTAMKASIPQKRPGLPEEIARPIAFLLSDDASFVNGTVLSVDGGALAGLPENSALELSRHLAQGVNEC